MAREQSPKFDLAPAMAAFLDSLPMEPVLPDVEQEVRRKIGLVRARFPLARDAEIERAFNVITHLRGSQAAYLRDLNMRKAQILEAPDRALPGELQRVNSDLLSALCDLPPIAPSTDGH